MFRMKMGFKQAIREKLFIVAFVAILVYRLYEVVDCYNVTMGLSEYEVLSFLKAGNSENFYYIVIFLFWSALLTYGYISNRMQELVFDIKGRINCWYVVALGCFNLLGVTIITAVRLFYTGRFANADGTIYMYTIIGGILYYFLPAMVSIILGAVIGRCKKIKLALVLLIVAAYLISPRYFEQTELVDNNTVREWLRVFNIADTYLYFPIDFFPFVEHGYKWARVMGLMLLAGAAFYSLFIRIKSKVITPLFLILGITGIALYGMDQTRPGQETEAWGYIESEYAKGNAKIKREDAQFKVTEYYLKINPGRQLQVECKMLFDKGDCDKYIFTLYRTFEVSSVRDIQGNNLKYEMDEGYLTVYPNGSNLTGIIIEYKGIPEYYVATDTYMYLPYTFPYYPVSGFKQVYTEDVEAAWCFDCINDYDAKFRIKVDTDNTVYASVDADDCGEFVGNVQGVTLCMGYLSEKTVKGITYICPTYCKRSSDEELGKMSDMLLQIESEYGYSSKGKKVFILEYSVLYEGTEMYFGDDHINIMWNYPQSVKKIYEELYGNAED